jgi:cyclopropane fatty-acyl-phospholipid synthase-like methyltransferase
MKKNNPLLTKYLSQQHSQLLAEMSPEQIEKEYVDKAYNGFGFDFHNKVIEEIKVLLETEVQAGDLLLDLGCGNGEYLKYASKGSFYVSAEKCQTMVPT